MRRDIASTAGWTRAGKLIVRLYFSGLVLWTAPVIAIAATNPGSDLPFGHRQRFLAVDRAFQLDVSWQGDDISVGWYIRPGYYLYRNRLGFSSPNAQLGKPVLPKGIKDQDPYFGKVVIYRHNLLVKLPVIKSGKILTLIVRYQGCADAGYCYPPQKRTLKVVNAQ